MITTLKGHKDYVRSISISNDNNDIISSSKDKTIKIWDSKNGNSLNTLKGHKSWV